MNLSTPVFVAPSPRPITCSDRLLLLGSCFADAMSRPFAEHYFRVTCNPFGTLYNPLSIASALSMRQVPDLVEWGGMYHSMAHHGDFSRLTAEAAYAACKGAVDAMQQALQDATVVLVTFGTSWVYAYQGQVVANCHKLPASAFQRRRLSADEIVCVWQSILTSYPDKQFVFTVSPIRHLKDGLHENQLSKAVLLQAVDTLCSLPSLPLRPIYFPSYEIVLDELRDYRFYADDMVHPSPLAVQYVWERFVRTFMSPDTQDEMRVLHQLWLDRHHTLLHPDSPEAARFVSSVESRLAALRLRYPWL